MTRARARARKFRQFLDSSGDRYREGNGRGLFSYPPPDLTLQSTCDGQHEEMLKHASSIGRVVDGPALFFDRSALDVLGRRLREDYAVAQPFPHVVLDDFLPAQAAARLLEEFPSIGEFLSDGSEGGNKIGKFDSTLRTELGPFTRGLLAQLCCSPFVNFLEGLSGIRGLVPDPHGIDRALRHFVRGGRLAIHADFNAQKALGLERRVNIFFI